jgi:membrane protease YdiL (CAAX protease family)
MSKSHAVKEAFIFLGLTLGLSYFVFWGPLAVFQVPTISFVRSTMGPAWAIALFVIGGFVPSLTAIFLTWKQEGKAGLRSLGRRVIQFNIGWRWYAAILGIVVLGTLGQLAIHRLLGQSFDGSLFIAQLGSALPLILLGPLSEELGWRGYALDRLQTRFNALVSSLIIGLVWGLWHLPLFGMVGTSQHELAMPFFGFLGGVMATSVLYTWLHNHTHASIWTAVFFHWVYTYAMQVVASGVTRSVTYNWLEYLPYVVIAVLVVLIWKPQTLTRKPEGKTP